MLKIAISKFDKVAIELVSRLPSFLRPFFRLMSYIGHPIPILGLGFAIVIYGIVQQKPELFFSGAFIWIALLVSTILKRTIERSRPLTEYVRTMHTASFSFPSGHTMGSTVAFGLLAYFAFFLLPQPLNYILLTLFTLLIIGVGVSRVQLGAHYPTDVIGGWILGSTILGIIIFAIEPLA